MRFRNELSSLAEVSLYYISNCVGRNILEHKDLHNYRWVQLNTRSCLRKMVTHILWVQFTQNLQKRLNCLSSSCQSANIKVVHWMALLCPYLCILMYTYKNKPFSFPLRPRSSPQTTIVRLHPHPCYTGWNNHK